ncbi:MAG: 50S ribosomal protein L4 [Patescibacteria group bacterium]
MATTATKKTAPKAAPKAAAKTHPAVGTAGHKPTKKVAAKTAAPATEVQKVEKVSPPLGAMEATIYGMNGASAGTLKLPEEIFGAKWNADLVHQVVIGMQANARPTVANTKFRSEVSGGGKKPWKQKGTGRARHGSSRSPIWRGGGVTHGPRAEKIYAVKINRKMRLAALKVVLARKWKDGEIIFIDRLTFDAPSTKLAKAAILAIASGSGKGTLATKRANAAVIAFAKKDTNAEKSLRNFGSFITEEVRNLNPVDLMNKKYLVMSEPADALKVLAERFAA